MPLASSPLRCIDKRTGWRRYYPSRKTILYYIMFSPKGRAPMYKIGITTKTVAKRFQYEDVPYTIIFTVTFKGGKSAYTEEQRILETYSEYLLPFERILKSGNSEIFSTDIRQYSNKGSL